MADIIIKTKQGEVIPQISPEAFGLAVQSMEEFLVGMDDLLEKAKALPKVYESRSDYERGASLLVQKKSLVKLSEATMLPFEELVKKVRTFIQTQKNLVGNHGEMVYSLVAPAMVAWDERERQAAAAEEKRKQAEKELSLRRENEEKAQKDAAAAEKLKKERIAQIREDLRSKKITKRQAEKFLNEAGAKEEAELTRISAEKDEADANAAVEAAKTKVRANSGAVAGITRRTNWHFTVIDPRLVKLKYLSPDAVLIGEAVRKIKNKKEAEKEVGGIEVTEDKTL
jgi:hypothetical protein